MFLSILRLGALEFLSSTFQRKLPAGIGARDFRVLVIFYVLLTILVTFFLSAYRWLPQRFEQTLLGNIEANTTLVRLRANYLRQYGLDHETMELFKQDPLFEGLQLSVQRDLIINQTSLIALPTNNRSLRLNALGIDRSSQFWLWLEANSQAPAIDKFELAAVINKSAFTEIFSLKDYEDYRQQVLDGDRAKLLAQYVPNLATKDDFSRLSHLVFFVTERSSTRVGENVHNLKYPHPFRIIWVDGLPLPEAVELVLPLDTVDLLQAVIDRPLARYAPEGRGASVNRVSALIGEKYGTPLEIQSQLRALINSAADCLTGENQPALPVLEDDDIIEVQAPWLNQPPGSISEQALQMNFSAKAVDKCWQRANANITELLEKEYLFLIKSREIGSAYEYLSPGLLASRCEYMNSQDEILASMYFSADAWQLCENDRESPLAGRLFADPFYEATVAVSKGKSLKSVTDSLVNWTMAASRARFSADYQADESATSNRESLPVFRLDANYKKSLARYNLLVDVMQSLLLPVIALLVATMMVLLVTKLHTMFENRLGQYQLLAINGIHPKWIALLIAYQSMLAALLGAVVGLVFGGLGIYLFSKYFALAKAELLQEIRESLGLSFDALLGQPPVTFLVVYVIMFSLAVSLLGYLVAWLLRITTAGSATAILRDT